MTTQDWLWEVDPPGTSHISGGIVTISPGNSGLGTLSPPLDRFSNRRRGQLASRSLAKGLGLDVFATSP